MSHLHRIGATPQYHRTRQAEEKSIQLQQKLEDLTLQTQTIEHKYNELIEKHQTINTELQKMNWQHDNLTQKLDIIQSESKELAQTVKQDKILMAEMNTTSAKQQQQIEQYKHSLAKAEEKIANITHKNLFLTQEKTELAAQIKFSQIKI